MTQTKSRIFDDVARLLTDATGMAQSMRREVEALVKTQTERLLTAMDLVKREEFEAVREMAIRARDENERLEARLSALESRRHAQASGPTIAL